MRLPGAPWRYIEAVATESPTEADEWALIVVDPERQRWVLSFRQNGELPVEEQRRIAKAITVLPELIAAAHAAVNALAPMPSTAASLLAYEALRDALRKGGLSETEGIG